MFIPYEEIQGQGFVKEYWSILTDPAHVAVELTLTFLIDGLLLGLLMPTIRSYVNYRLHRQHAELDQEHGIRHHDDHIHREGVHRGPLHSDHTPVLPRSDAAVQTGSDQQCTHQGTDAAESSS